MKIKPCLKQLFQVYFPVLPGLQIRYHHSHHSHHFPLHKTTSQHQNLGFLQRSCTGHGHVHSILRRLGAKRRVPTNTWGNFRHWFCKKLLETNGKTQKLSSWPVNRLEMLKWRNQSLIYWFRILKKNLLQYTLIFPKGAFSPKKNLSKGVRIDLAPVLAHSSGGGITQIYGHNITPTIYLKGDKGQGLSYTKIGSIV